MTWYFGGAALITVLFLLNAVYVHRLRSRGVLARKPREAQLKRAMSGSDIVVALLPVAAVGVGLAMRTLAPDNVVGQAMASPWVIICLLPWTAAVAAAISIVAWLSRRRRASRLR